MDILSYLTLLVIFVVPIAIGFLTVWFLKGVLRIWIIAIEWIIPAAWIVFYFSPLPRQLGLTRDPGYDSQAIWLAVLYIAALGFLILSAVGMGFSALIRRARRLEARLNNIP
jgi:hypothetical protein